MHGTSSLTLHLTLLVGYFPRLDPTLNSSGRYFQRLNPTLNSLCWYFPRLNPTLNSPGMYFPKALTLHLTLLVGTSQGFNPTLISPGLYLPGGGRAMTHDDP